MVELMDQKQLITYAITSYFAGLFDTSVSDWYLNGIESSAFNIFVYVYMFSVGRNSWNMTYLLESLYLF